LAKRKDLNFWKNRDQQVGFSKSKDLLNLEQRKSRGGQFSEQRSVVPLEVKFFLVYFIVLLFLQNLNAM